MRFKLILAVLSLCLWSVKPGDTTPVLEKVYEAEETNRIVLLDTVPLLGDEQILIQERCNEIGLDYRFVYALIHSESRFKWVIGDGGLNHPSIGYFQISTINQERMMDDFGFDIYDKVGNIESGMQIIKELYEQYKDGFNGYDAETCIVMCYKCGSSRGRELMKEGFTLEVVETIKNMKSDFDF